LADDSKALDVYYLLVGFVTGAVILGLEVLAARTMAPVLGSGPVAWSALLAVALGSLAAGNLAGGVLSDRVRPGAAIAWSLVAAAVSLVALSVIHKPVVRWAGGLSLFCGALTASLCTQLVPMSLLGIISPVLLRARREGSRGTWAGLVLACGSVGGIAGALLMGTLLLPALGLTRCYLLPAGLLAGAAFPAALRERRWVALGLGIASLVLASLLALWRAGDGATQSRHGQIEIRTIGDAPTLLIDGIPQTAMPLHVRKWRGLDRGYLLELALLLRGQPPPRRALVIGLGAGLAPRTLELHGVSCESVEIDPVVVQVARREFAFGGTVTIADGRAFLWRTERTWDLIVLDVCTSEQLATHLFTVEALALVRERLAPHGVLAIQFIGGDGPWTASLARTARKVFEGAIVVAPRLQPVPVGPQWLFASQTPIPPPPRESEGPGADVPWQVVDVEGGGALLTDDHFPAELDWARTAALWRRWAASGTSR